MYYVIHPEIKKPSRERISFERNLSTLFEMQRLLKAEEEKVPMCTRDESLKVDLNGIPDEI